MLKVIKCGQGWSLMYHSPKFHLGGIQGVIQRNRNQKNDVNVNRANLMKIKTAAINIHLR
jgi:hypothetical protein